MKDGGDLITCCECGKELKTIATFHLRQCCGLSVKEYKAKYPNAPIRAKCVGEKISKLYKDPNSGYNTPEHKEFRRQRALDNWSDEGRWRTEECTQRRSYSTKAAWNKSDSVFRTEEHFQKRSIALVKRWQNPKDGIGLEEANRKRSVGMLMQWADPNGNMNSDDANAKRSAITAAIWAQPESPYRTEECSNKRSKAAKLSWKKGLYDGVFKSPTSIEIAISEALDWFNIKHQPQWRPDGCSRVYDEFVYPNNLIEIHGSYWHSSKEQQEKDLEKARWAHRNGYNFIAIWDFHLKKYGPRFLVEKWIFPLNPNKGSVREPARTLTLF